MSETSSASPNRLLTAVLSREGGLVSQTVVLVAAQATASLLGFAFWVAASRWYDYDTIGRAATTINAALLVALFAKLGLDSFLATHLGENPKAGGLARASLWVTLAAAILLGLALLPLSQGLDAGRIVLGLALAAALAVGLVLDGILIGVGRSRSVLARAAAVGILRIAVLVGAAAAATRYGAWGASAILWAWVLSGAVVVLFVASALRSVPKTASAFSPRETIALVSSGFSNSIASTVLAAPGLLFPILLAWRGQFELSGIFYFMWMIIALFHMVPTAMGLALLGSANTSPARQRHALAFSLAAVGFGWVLLAGLGRPLLGLYGGPVLQAYYLPTVVLALSALIACGNHFHMSRLRQQKRWTSLALSAASTAVGALVVAWVLIPSTGIWGIVLAWFLSQGAFFALTTLLIHGGRRNSHGNQRVGAVGLHAHRGRIRRRESRG